MAQTSTSRFAYYLLRGVGWTAWAGVLFAMGLVLLWVHAKLNFSTQKILLPGETRKLHLPPGRISGISGDKTFTVNRLGLRGPPPPPVGKGLWGVAIGSSTTLEKYLDDTETWPAQLASRLSKQLHEPVVINSAGHGGMTARHMVLMAEALLGPHQRRPDVILWLGGATSPKLLESQRPTYRGLSTKDESKAFFYHLHPTDSIWSLQPSSLLRQHLKLLEKRFRKGTGALLSRFVDTEKENEDEGKSHPLRTYTGPVWQEIPPQVAANREAALADFSHDVQDLIDRCNTAGVRLVILSQPTWDRAAPNRTNHDADTVNLVDGKHLPTHFRGILLGWYRTTLQQLAEKNGTDFIDLFGSLTGPGLFYDDLHFTEKGAREASEKLTPALLEILKKRTK